MTERLRSRLDKLEGQQGHDTELALIPADATLDQAQRVYSENLRLLHGVKQRERIAADMDLAPAERIYRPSLSA